ncbi:MAG: hypothetical protein RID07_14725, partial [Lacipirellulaceae bacterium]
GWVNKAPLNQRSSIKLKTPEAPLVENPFRTSTKLKFLPEVASSTVLVGDNRSADIGIDLRIPEGTEKPAGSTSALVVENSYLKNGGSPPSSTISIAEPLTAVINPFVANSPTPVSAPDKVTSVPPKEYDLAEWFNSGKKVDQMDGAQPAERQIASETSAHSLADPEAGESETPSIDISELAVSMDETANRFVGTFQPTPIQENSTPYNAIDEAQEETQTDTSIGEVELSFAPSTLIEGEELVLAAPAESLGRPTGNESDEGGSIQQTSCSLNCPHAFMQSVDATLMNDIDVDLRPQTRSKSNDSIIEGPYSGRLPKDRALAARGSLDNGPQLGTGCRRYCNGNVMLWAAPQFHHQPLYFEQPMLERHGHYVHGNCVHSVLSAAHFFGSIPLLPYKIGAHPPLSCDYTLGHWRPGNCTPRTRFIPEVSTRGLVYESMFVTGSVFLVP